MDSVRNQEPDKEGEERNRLEKNLKKRGETQAFRKQKRKKHP
jgi:hypothetical protein